MPQSRTRNFCIIAHIDHGKSTLADRLLEATGTVEKRKMRDQLLDAMDIERERGITIKLTPVHMEYEGFHLNLIDTPGHVDFSYEVSRSLAAVEGAILLVDISQGIQAQTLANLELARQAGLVIIPVVNKIDLPGQDVTAARTELGNVAGVPPSDVLLVSGKTGAGVTELLTAIIRRIPAPQGGEDAPFRGLVFDSTFDAYKGVVVYVRVADGAVSRGAPLAFAASGSTATALDLGTFQPQQTSTPGLHAGDIGYVATGLRDTAEARVGDTLLLETGRGQVMPLPGYAVPEQHVYAGVYPVPGGSFPSLRAALEKLRLSDASVSAQIESSPALGQGYRCGFLGLLHVEIVRERLQREFGVDVTLTVPSVAYRVVTTGGKSTIVRSATEFPDPSGILEVHEPWVRVRVIGRREDVGGIIQLLAARGAAPAQTESLARGRIAVAAELPLRTVVANFHDALKAATSGYGSFSLTPAGERPIDLVRLTILVHQEPVEALSVLVPAGRAETEGRRIVEQLKTAVPRHLFPVPLQAAVGGKIIARETIPALRKDVTGYLYGGDVTRKRKLLEKQKKGKLKLAARSVVTIPPEAYLAVLKG